MGMNYDQKIRPFLKWAGGKYSLMDHIRQRLPTGSTLIEPFVGAGAVFLNTDYPAYVLSDTNRDLIDLYQCLKQEGASFINDARRFFTAPNNTEKSYYVLRERFNRSEDSRERGLLFLYLNRHCYNGLCRYNGSGGFNVPFGRYSKPYFPQMEMELFHEKAQKARFICGDFRATMKKTRKNQVVYCDPPYVPLSISANFTQYCAKEFSLQHHEELAILCRELGERGAVVLLSNHDTPFTRKIYRGADIQRLQVRRTISGRVTMRDPVWELLALFGSASR